MLIFFIVYKCTDAQKGMTAAASNSSTETLGAAHFQEKLRVLKQLYGPHGNIKVLFKTVWCGGGM